MKTKLKELEELINERYKMPAEAFNNNPFFVKANRINRSIIDALKTIEKRLDDITGDTYANEDANDDN